MSSTPIKVTKINKKNSQGFRCPNLIAEQPLIGVMMFLLGVLIFGVIAYYVQQRGSLVQWDIVIANHMHETALNSPQWIKNIMLSGYYIGLHGYMLIGVILIIYFLFKKFWEELLMVVILYVGEGIIWQLLTKYFDRTRPKFIVQIGAAINYPSFPSGHTFSVVICFGLLTYFFVPKIQSRFLKAVVIILAVLMMLFIGYSRFFMGAHYLTDVVAGLAVGVAWTSLVITLIEILFKKGGYKNVKEEESYTS